MNILIVQKVVMIKNICIKNHFDALIFIQENSDVYGAKVTSEHQLPISTKQLRTTNECIVATLHNYCQALEKVFPLFFSLHFRDFGVQKFFCS